MSTATEKAARGCISFVNWGIMTINHGNYYFHHQSSIHLVIDVGCSCISIYTSTNSWFLRLKRWFAVDDQMINFVRTINNHTQQQQCGLDCQNG